MSMYKLMIAVFLLGTLTAKRPKQMTLSEKNKQAEYSGDLKNNEFGNFFEIMIADEELLEQNDMNVVIESENPNLVLAFYEGNSSYKNKSKILLDVNTNSGNIGVVFGKGYLNDMFSFLKETGQLRFQIQDLSENPQNSPYTIKIDVGKVLHLNFNKVYQVQVDQENQSLKINTQYDGTTQTNLQKLRFQIGAVQFQPDFKMKSSLQVKNQTFTMNNIFKKIVGGILSLPNLPVCLDKNCSYDFNLEIEKVSMINVETKFISEIEELSVEHFDSYYDRTYQDNQTTYYKLKYIKDIDQLDLSINLIPVIGDVQLYVNAKTKPLKLENYDYKETGPLAKRITVKWEDLVSMEAQGSDLYIAVHSPKPGEFSLRIDAHESGTRGMLQQGITEAGYVKMGEIENYYYYIEVFQTQEVSFKAHLNIISGEANLYLKQCDGNNQCSITSNDLSDVNLLKKVNTENNKEIAHNFTCEASKNYFMTTCKFIIGVEGKEGHGTHYDISVSENNFHRLIAPGKAFPVNLIENEQAYFKLSYPNLNQNSELFMEVEYVWGEFDLYVSRTQEYPSKGNNEYHQNFNLNHQGYLNSFKTIPVSEMSKEGIVGIYYLGINAVTSCNFKIKFFEKSVVQNSKNTQQIISVHTLEAGQQKKGEIGSKNEVVYYTVKVSSDKINKRKTRITLTSIKGNFIMFANKNGKMPTKEKHQFYSDEYSMTFPPIEKGDKIEEYIVGVQMASKVLKSNLPTQDKYQFMISFTYDQKALKLNPGVLETHLVKQSDLFYLEIKKDMNTILVLKTIVDGYNIDMCASFSDKPEYDILQPCEFSAEKKNNAILLDRNDMNQKCSTFEQCFMHLKIRKGTKNEKYQIGYTYNDLPFQLSKGQMFTGPSPLNSSTRINFVYHPLTDMPCNLYFNSKGHDVIVRSKIINSITTPQDQIEFPNQATSDWKLEPNSYIQSLYYSIDQIIQFGKQPEILISITGKKKEKGVLKFDSDHVFLLQATDDSKEILRTHTETSYLNENQWYFYHFYNNGSGNNLRVYVNSDGYDNLEIQLAKGLQSRPPFSKALVSKKGVQNITLELTKKDFNQIDQEKKNNLKGNFVLGVKSEKNSKVHIFWNNKKDLNYIELTPGEEHSMTLEAKRQFYFQFFVKDIEKKKKGKIVIYIRTNIETQTYLLKSDNNDMDAPSKSNFTWKTQTGEIGGLSAIEILPNDPDYATDSVYVGNIISKTQGTLHIMVDIEHEGFPLELQLNSPFPSFLEPHEKKIYSFYNPDADLLDLTVSMFGGYVDVYISSTKDVSENKFKENYSLRKNLEAHKLIVIAPSIKYDIHQGHKFYMMIKNTTDKTASMLLTLDKNNVNTPIMPGIRKMARLAPGETKNFFYKPNPKENKFEVQFELRQVFQEKFKDQALSLIQDYIEIYYMTPQGDRFKLKYKSKTSSKNRVYVELDMNQNNQNTFTIHIYNPVASGVTISIDLLNGGYRMMHLNEHQLDYINPGDYKLYEAYGHKGKYLYFDMKMCYGEVDVDFYESEFNDLDSKKYKHKSIKDNNNFLHYIKLTNKRVFFKVSNTGKKSAYFDMHGYIKKSLRKSQYAEVAQLDDGKIKFETDSNKINFTALQIKSHYDENFLHQITYTVYLSQSMGVMRYVKSCGEFMLDKNFGKQNTYIYSIDYSFETEKIIEHKGTLQIELLNLPTNTKFYGVLVADVKIFPKELGYLTPIRSNKVFYDEFIYVSPKYHFPLVYMVSITFCFGIIFMIFFIVKNYIFGKINQMEGLERLSNLKDFDEGSLGYSVMKAMESGLFQELKAEEIKQQENEIDEKIEQEEALQNIEVQVEE